MADMTKIKMTKAEFMALPESMERIELIDGELIRQEDGVATPKKPHQIVVGNIYFVLRQTLHSGEVIVSPMDVYLDEDVVQPDVFWVSGVSSLCQAREDDWYHGAPDLAIEVLSPSTKKRDRGRKFKQYEQNGVREYWLIDTDDQTVEVYRRDADRFIRFGFFEKDQTFAFGLLPDVTITVGEIFK